MILSIGLVLFNPTRNVYGTGQMQIDTPYAKASAKLDNMTPEERVGQLFLVTFNGRTVTSITNIYNLISDYHIGGVILSSSNDNFVGPDDTVKSAFDLTTSLQKIEWENSSQSNDNFGMSDDWLEGENYIPLFIGISQEGDGYPYDQILSGITQLPNQMTIGATWDPSLAEKVGNLMAKELTALGFNLYLGPSLDVLDVSITEGGEDLGTRTFGSDPYWVGKMGQSYIKGLHEGSDDQLMVIAKHFPGRGGSDRRIENEVATVRKSLEQLKQIELAPFFDVTGKSPDTESRADGLLVSHIRYQGFQGNIRATTRPVSFDQAALEQIMALNEFSRWREDGGIIMSDNLGTQAVRRFYDPTDRAFNARQVASNAFLAGNDLLYLDNFIATGDEDSYTTIIKTLNYFSQKYSEDVAFAEKVDQSVLRILTMKYKMYSDFNLDNVIPSDDDLLEVGKGQQLNFEVAQKSVTLISPDTEELKTILPRPPEIRERIVFLTDILTKRQCSNNCPEQIVMQVDALQNAVLKQYGPNAGGQVISSRLSSYSFADLLEMLDNISEDKNLEDDLTLADWVIISFMDIDQKRPSSLAFKRLLSESPNILRNKKVIAFSFNAPYFIDATDISKLTGYYGIYSKAPTFIDAAARVLFQELTPQGALPVSVPGVGYDIIKATSPDPNQVIPLVVDVSALPVPTVEISGSDQDVTPVATQAPMFKVGDVIPLRTGEIYDKNKHIVPDGTVARFQITISGGESGTVQQIDSVTKQGIARAEYRINTPGLLEIRVISEPALTSELLQLNISSEGEAVAITAIVPLSTGSPTDTPEPTVIVTQTPVSTEDLGTINPVNPSSDAGSWLVTMSLVWLGALGIFLYSRRFSTSRWGARMGLLAVMGGLFFYLLIVTNLLQMPAWISQGGLLSTLFVVIIGMLIGWLVGFIWNKIETTS